jgi:hypothetical protein
MAGTLLAPKSVSVKSAVGLIALSFDSNQSLFCGFSLFYTHKSQTFINFEVLEHDQQLFKQCQDFAMIRI